MASKKEPVGFLSRVATLFRDNADARPASDPVATQEPSDEEHARSQEVIAANKRRDDLVRKREFDYLRKIRKSGLGRRTISSTGTARPSVFQASSSFGLQERAVTLQKINAIESTIVASWKKVKPETQPDAQPEAQPEVLLEIQPDVLPEVAEDFDLDFTAMPAPSLTAAPPVERPQHGLEQALQDAAYLFAEGQSDDAANTLQALYRDNARTADDAALLAHALFDLYRTIGASAAFDALALNYAQRFGRSPAEWFSLPELLHDGDADTPPPEGSEWICPALLDVAPLRTLQAQFDDGHAPSVLNWSALQTLPADTGPDFAALLAYWAQQPVEMQWVGEHALLRALEHNSPANVRSSSPLWWHIRLNVLCLLQLQTAFETLALEYCVLFEESPPCWQENGGRVLRESEPQDYAALISSLVPLEAAPQAWQDLHCTLYGDALGLDSAALKTLHAIPAQATHVTVDCSLLGRIDRSAASTVVQWARTYAAQGCEIEFTQLTHLLAILLHSVGADAYAQLSVRRQ
jgi:ABC-type transporter Mla MlaB component